VKREREREEENDFVKLTIYIFLSLNTKIIKINTHLKL